MENSLDNVFSLKINRDARIELGILATWARLTAILAFVTYGLSFLALIIKAGRLSATELISQLLGALIGGALGVAINYFLYRFAVNARNALQGENQIELDLSLNDLRTYFKILGILSIIVCALLVIVMLFALLGNLAAG